MSGAKSGTVFYNTLLYRHNKAEDSLHISSRRNAMPRKPPWMQVAEGATYHDMSRGHNRETLFADADDHRYFLGASRQPLARSSGSLAERRHRAAGPNHRW